MRDRELAQILTSRQTVSVTLGEQFQKVCHAFRKSEQSIRLLRVSGQQPHGGGWPETHRNLRDCWDFWKAWHTFWFSVTVLPLILDRNWYREIGQLWTPQGWREREERGKRKEVGRGKREGNLVPDFPPLPEVFWVDTSHLVHTLIVQREAYFD